MRYFIRALMACAISAAVTPSYAKGVSVEFDHPERYTDAGDGYGIGAERPVLAEIRNYLTSLGQRLLGPDQFLRVDVLNIDLAGELEPWRRAAYDTRILRDVYTPKIRLRYRLTEGSRTISQGEETVSDVNYLANPGARSQQGPLRYEKAMLWDWLRSLLRQ